MGVGFCPQLGGVGHAPPSAFGRAAASPQTRQMRCWLSSERTTNPSSRRKRQDSRSLSLVLFPPKPLRWVSAGALLGEVIKTPVLHFRHFRVGGITYPPVAVAVSEQPGAGFISAEKTAFSEWVLCADGHAVPSCTQRFFGVPAWGWYHYPRRALRVLETPDGRLSKRLICRFLRSGGRSSPHDSYFLANTQNFLLAVPVANAFALWYDKFDKLELSN